MEFIKTISLRMDKDSDDKLKELQKSYFQKYGIKIDQSSLIRKLIHDVHTNSIKRSTTSKIDIDTYYAISNK